MAQIIPGPLLVSGYNIYEYVVCFISVCIVFVMNLRRT